MVSEPICSIPGCGKPVMGRAWCSMHYARWRKHGDSGEAEPRHTYHHGERCAVHGCRRPSQKRAWCDAHYQRWLNHGDPTVVLTEKDKSVEQRFWERVAVTEGCWLWMGHITHKGYGRFRSRTAAHRWSYELHVGPIPEGLELDHLCRVRCCVNPAHLEPVTSRENTLRGNTIQARNAAKTHCPRGHPYDETNTRWEIRAGGTLSRICRACTPIRRAAARQQLREQGLAPG